MQEAIAKYVNAGSTSSRIKALTELKEEGQSLPISFVEDMLCLNLSKEEQLALMDVVGSEDNIALEHFLTSGIETWTQDLASLAIRRWSRDTKHLLWFRILPLADSRLTSQRVLYTILEQCCQAAGDIILNVFLEREGIEELSEAFHGLLMTRCLQWDIHHPRIDAIAQKCLETSEKTPWPGHKALAVSIAWLARHNEYALRKAIQKQNIVESWRDLIQAISFSKEKLESHFQDLDQWLNENKLTDKHVDDLKTVWTPLWLRNQMSQKTLDTAIKWVVTSIQKNQDKEDHWKLFAGCSTEALKASVIGMEDDQSFITALALTKSFFTNPFDEEIVASVRERVKKSSNPGLFFSSLPGRLHLEIVSELGNTNEEQKRILEEEKQVLEDLTHMEYQIFLDYNIKAENDDDVTKNENVPELRARKNFFNLAYRHQFEEFTSQNYWSQLQKSWREPKIEQLADLAKAARKQPELYKISYIHALGQFRGHDEAALKLLDFIRTSDYSEMQSVIHALSGIDTPRAQQEMISAITRPNVNLSLQIEICNLLKGRDLSKLQLELRSALNDLSINADSESGFLELREALSDLISVQTSPIEQSEKSPEATTSSGDLDNILSKKIPNYQSLSSEVRRALRTAQFFDDQVQGVVSSAHSIDLSPVIDMQYKALELLFREQFEQICFQIISDGILQRKLDVIGYARPIPKAMDEFERYIGSLPIIKEIPYFSKFKLRKMLRAICQYRPGKRFTLDGIKAFSLFFISFGRHSCRYGLEEIAHLGFKDDKDLAEYCKKLHIFQDFRNRAAHEGFHPDAHNNIGGIWEKTADIIEGVFEIKSHFEFKPVTGGHFGGAFKQPVVERKPSKPPKAS